MRIRLRLLLPLAVGVLVGLGFVLAGATVGDAVRESLLTVPGLARERAVEAAVRAVSIGGVVATLVAVVASYIVARMVAVPLSRMQQAAQRLAESEVRGEQPTPVAEIQDVARDMDRAAGELRARRDRDLRELAELAALVEAVSEGIVQVGPDGRVARVNGAGRRLLGLPEDVLGRPVAAVVRNRELRRLIERGARGAGVEPAEVVLDERRLLVGVVAQPEHGGGAVVTAVDLTDLRRLEEVRRDFVANASHELKTPLTSIRGYTETLLGGDLPAAEHQQFLETISRNAERLQRIVDDLLDLSRIESGKWRPEAEPLDVIEVAERCWLGFADRAAAQGVSFSATTEIDGRALAVADMRALEQVLANLFDNALRYTPAHGRIRVTARRVDGPDHGERRGAGGGTAGGAGGATGAGTNGGRLAGTTPTGRGPWLVVDVSDTGTGIPRDALPRIFERFYRVDPARSRAEGGTGLGLSIVKHMMESMGGAASARSELGNGTTIRLWLEAVTSS